MKIVPRCVLEPPERVLQVTVFYQVGYVRVARAPQRLNPVLARQHQQGKRRIGSEGNPAAVEEAQELAEDPLALFRFFQLELL